MLCLFYIDPSKTQKGEIQADSDLQYLLQSLVANLTIIGKVLTPILLTFG